MAFWQYQLLKDYLNDLSIEESVLFSWIPSITQLSRQAIFRGSKPSSDYNQGPRSENKLWDEYWSNRSISSSSIQYIHGSDNLLDSLNGISRYAIVLKDLDEKMHSSSDYVDLKTLTTNWFLRSNIASNIKALVDMDFSVYLTSDHGNIPSKGWRNLRGTEKLGANRSGSRSARHIEFSERELADKFIMNNPDLSNNIHQKDSTVFLSNELSFKKEGYLVTHGGSHLLEVLIPFIKITKK